MSMYNVTWEIDIEADNATDAARKALRIHRDPDSIATVFGVCEYGQPVENTETIDLLGIDLQTDKQAFGYAVDDIFGGLCLGESEISEVTE